MDNHALTELIHRERTAVLMVNVRSRSGARHFYHIFDALQRRGIEVIAADPVRDPSRLPEIASRAIGQDSHLVVVGGGDGTISAVSGFFVGTNTVMGIIPLGTGNSTARTLGIPQSINRACDILLHGEVAEVDLGKIDDDFFINTISVGLSAEAARRTPNWLKKYLGILAYPVVGAAVFLRHRPFHCHLQTDGRQIIANVSELVIANGRYFGETIVSPEASIRDGLLTVQVLVEMGKWTLAWWLFRYLVLRKTCMPGAQALSVTEIQLDADPPQYIDIDGEAILSTPARITVVQRALKVLLPHPDRI